MIALAEVVASLALALGLWRLAYVLERRARQRSRHLHIVNPEKKP